ncbi:MAG: class I SAM-dependent methyltransferase [Desulfomonile tiedjei]|uniref:Class I SAM-dependent methyltransferase n=1 Tax=Desulfomonile tiedjei TaxID=2358 RepID=A0A9D6V3E6_9BACT|nr:class I SAM-dependent methyltransferase [Desulfomonile tiedjei]
MGGLIETEYTTCDLCGSEDQTLLYSKIDPVTDQEFHVVECRCGMAFVNPMPSEACIPKLYPPDYMEGKELMDSRYSRMLDLLPDEAGGRLLDIGCARGDFILRAQRRGWSAEGVDLIPWNRSEHPSILIGDLIEMDLPENYYDAITAWAVLEHVRRPSLYFRKVSTLLKDKGLFIFIVPNFDALGMRRSCSEDIPRHLWLFTTRSVKSYLEKNGMDVVRIMHNSSIYTAYPFGLLRDLLYGLSPRPRHCSAIENRSVSLLRNAQLRGNLLRWLSEVRSRVKPSDMLLDALDLAMGVALSKWSSLIRNYGIITVIASKNGEKKLRENQKTS